MKILDTESGCRKSINAVDAFYGVRCNADNDPHPHFYYAGAVVSGVTHWHYREEPEKS